MERFEVASKCRKIRDEILYFKYGKTRLTVEFPTESKIFFETTSRKLKTMSYQSTKEIEKDIQDYAESIGMAQFAAHKKNSFEKYLESVLEEYADEESTREDDLKAENPKEGSGNDADSDADNDQYFVKTYDNFTELDTETFAGYCQAVCRALLPHFHSTLLGPPVSASKSTLDDSKMKRQGANMSISNARQFEVAAERDIRVVESLLSRVHEHGRVLGDKLAQRHGIYNIEADWRLQEEQARARARHGGVGAIMNYFDPAGNITTSSSNSLSVVSSSSGRVIKNPYARSAGMYDFGYDMGASQLEGVLKRTPVSDIRKRLSGSDVERPYDYSSSGVKKKRSSPPSGSSDTESVTLSPRPTQTASTKSMRHMTYSATRRPSASSAMSDAIASAVARGALPPEKAARDTATRGRPPAVPQVSSSVGGASVVRQHQSQGQTHQLSKYMQVQLGPAQSATTPSTSSRQAPSTVSSAVSKATAATPVSVVPASSTGVLNGNNRNSGSSGGQSSASATKTSPAPPVAKSKSTPSSTSASASASASGSKVSTPSALAPTPVIGRVGVTQDNSVGGIVNYFSEVNVCGRQVRLGDYTSINLAAQAHDLALIRAIGPAACSSKDLNCPIKDYSSVPLSFFTAYDDVLRKGLFGSSWTGPKPCDFSFLLLRGTSSTGMSQKIAK